jgi:L-seryl-tRNA(Ser) seleniumtransferase
MPKQQPESSAELRRLPAVDVVLGKPSARLAEARFGRDLTLSALRAMLGEMRAAGQGGATADELADTVLDNLVRADAPTLRQVLNLTGTVLHTNLGRAILPEVAIEAAVEAMRSAVTLEYDLETGGRGERDSHLAGLIRELTGAEACVVVNNNAAAVLLALAALSGGRETLVSRGELVEIGGSFRIPDIMRRAGAKLHEVGTTNRTHLADYADAISARTAAIMKVHPSNYRIVGFTHEVPHVELASLARDKSITLIDDLGSGTLVDLSRYGLAKERRVQDALSDGADIVTFSTDKLLGGPQLGIIAGRADLVRRCARHPLKRALRADKIRIAALAATLKLYRHPERLPETLPVLQSLTRNPDEMRKMAEQIRPALSSALGPQWLVEVAPMQSQIGSGALPTTTLPGFGLLLSWHQQEKRSGAITRLATRFRRLSTPVIGRVQDSAFHLDLRCLEGADTLLALLPALERTR